MVESLHSGKAYYQERIAKLEKDLKMVREMEGEIGQSSMLEDLLERDINFCINELNKISVEIHEHHEIENDHKLTLAKKTTSCEGCVITSWEL